jgi:hypothetical protein
MPPEYIKSRIDYLSLRDKFKKIGVNLVTAGVVGVFITHQVGASTLVSIGSCILVIGIGITCLYLGIKKEET